MRLVDFKLHNNGGTVSVNVDRLDFVLSQGAGTLLIIGNERCAVENSLDEVKKMLVQRIELPAKADAAVPKVTTNEFTKEKK